MRHKSAYQVSASQVLMVANYDGSKSGVFYVVKSFCKDDASDHFFLSQVFSYEADFREQWSLLVVRTFPSFPWPNPLTAFPVPVSFVGWWLRTNGLAGDIATDCGYIIGQTACS